MFAFSVCMSVYHNDNPTDFLLAVYSVTNKQFLKPSELILVIDGPISFSLESAILQIKKEIKIPLNLIRLPNNLGHAGARQAGLQAAKHEYIAIMDSDDISLPDRFEKQVDFLSKHKNIDICGGQISEFIDDEKNVVGQRIVPLIDKDIKTYMKSRCPMNLVTVMFKKSSVQKVGGYIHWYCEEDYYLWIRMVMDGCLFANLSDTLVNVRVGKEMYSRRGGWLYFKSEANLQKYMWNKKMISFIRLLYNIIVRFIIQVLMPNAIRGFIFQKLFRKK